MLKSFEMLNRTLVWFLLLVAASHAAAFPGETLPVTVGLPGFGPLGASTNPSSSSDGRFVAFESTAPDLVLGDSNRLSDVFVTDRQTGVTTRVSVSSAGIQGNAGSSNPAISADGRFVAFESSADNLVASDTNGTSDVFVRDLTLGITTRVSIDFLGTQGNSASRSPSVSADGRIVAFSSAANNLVPGDTNTTDDVFVRDMVLGTTSRVSVDSAGTQGNAQSQGASISADGLFVAFSSSANNLVAGDTNFGLDVFVRDLSLGTTTRASVDSSGTQGNTSTGSSSASISADGRYVAFNSDSTNLVAGDNNNATDVFVRDLSLNTTTRVSVDSAGLQANTGSYEPAISADGQRVAFWSSSSNLVAGDTNNTLDVFVRDTALGTTSRVSVNSSGVQGNDQSNSCTISGNGVIVAFLSAASNLSAGDTNNAGDIFIRDLSLSTTARVSLDSAGVQGQGNANSALLSISADGRFVALYSAANNLVAGDTNNTGDVFVRDMVLGTISRVSIDSAGTQGNAESRYPSISSDGRFVAFYSDATNLVTGDTNVRTDVFVRDRQLGTTTRVSVDSSGTQGDGNSTHVSISANGRFVAFSSTATNLVVGDTNGRTDIFVRDRQLGTTTRVSVDSAGAQVNGNSGFPFISADGQTIGFQSGASNLVAGDTNAAQDTFVRNLALGTTTRASVDSAGTQANGASTRAVVSADGNYVAFWSDASNLVVGDTNGKSDCFVRNLSLGTTTRVSVDSSGAQGNSGSTSPTISQNGRFVAFSSDASNHVAADTNSKTDVFVRDLTLGVTTRISVDSTGLQANSSSSGATISADGGFVVFGSQATNLTAMVKSDSFNDVFRHELPGQAGPIKIQLVFESWTGAVLPATADYILQKLDGTLVSSGTVSVAADGKIEIPKPASGDYKLYVKSWVFLQKKTTFTQGTSTVDLGALNLVNGDCDGDNVVSVFDYILLSNAFDTAPGDPAWDARADLDGDEVVSVFDYIVLSDNFDREGE